MKKVLEKINNTLSLQVYQILRYGMFFLSGVVFTRSGLSLSSIGEYETFIFIAGAFSFFGISAIINSTLSSFHAHPTHKSPFFFNIFMFMLLFGGVLSLLIWQLPQLAHAILRVDLGIFESRLLAIYLLFSAPAYLLEYVYLLKNKAISILTYGIFSFTLHILLVIVPVLVFGEIQYAFIGLVVTAFIKFCWVIRLVYKYSVFKWDGPIMRHQVRATIPLALASFLSGCGDYIDGVLVSNYYDKSVFAIFRYGARELPLSMLLANAMSMSLLPQIASNAQATYAQIKKKSLKLMHYLFPISMILMLVSHFLYSHIFNTSFSTSAQIFNIYLLLIFSRLIFPQTIVMGLGKSNIIFIASLIEICINIVASLFLMQWFGLFGIAFGTILAFYSEKLFLILWLKGKAHIHPVEYIPIIPLLSYSIILWSLFLLENKYF